MKKQLKSLLADYLKQVLSKPFSASEILDTYEIAVIYAYTEDRYEALNERLRKNLGQLDTDFGQELIRILEHNDARYKRQILCILPKNSR